MIFWAVSTTDCAGRERTRVKNRRNYGAFREDGEVLEIKMRQSKQ